MSAPTGASAPVPSASSSNSTPLPPSISPTASDDSIDTHPCDPTCFCVEFELGNPTVELITGRMFLTDQPPPLTGGEDDGPEDERDEEEVEQQKHQTENRCSASLAYIFDIPAHLTLNELHEFLMDAGGLIHIQLTRVPSRAGPEVTYAALLAFRTPAAATEFVQDYDGVAYNSLESDVCVTGFVWKVLFDEEKYKFPASFASNTGAITPIPQLTLGKAHSREAPSPLMTACAPSPSLIAPSASTLLLPPSSVALTPSHTPALGATDPFPSCPVCLEAIVPSSASPMVTILCYHQFHLECLAKWIPSSSSSSCPVCRYLMQPNVNTQCSTCKATDKLWLCILCGHVGCSRYSLGHAHQHWQQTGHNYSIEVLTQRVWDYTADCYVHRLVRNKADGKLVELSRMDTLDSGLPESAGGFSTPSKSFSGGASMVASPAAAATPTAPGVTSGSLLRTPSALIHPSSSAYASVKLEEFLLEYNYLLSSQLEQQRRIFQHSLKSCENDMNERRTRLEKELDQATKRKQELEQKLEKANTTHTESTAQLSNLQASQQSLQATSIQLSSLHSKLLQDHSSIRTSMATSSKLYEQQQESILKEQDTAIAGLEEQIHDLLFFLDTQKKIDRMDAQSKRAGKGGVGLKKKLQSGQAELQLVEVGADEDEAKGRRQKRRG